jgi:SpoVK/Ycf46/Vps4 family AAA+-type ATPase
MESFNVSDKVKNLMSRMLKSDQSLSLLLYGKPGSGKTEFAKTLAKESGLKVYVFKNERELSGEKDQNVLARLNCLLSMNSTDSLYIIDEADSLLRTCDSSFFGMKMPSKIKGTVNKMLEESRNKIIWIVNFTSQIDESTLRRFTYSYKFDSMPRSQLRSITETKLKPLALPCGLNNQILDLMEQYKVTGASVDNVIKTIKSLGEEKASLVQDIKSVLKENALLINGKSRMRERVSGNYDLSVLNASMEPSQIVRMIQNATDFAEKSGGTGDAQNGIRMLFYGVSGTGKTEFARYIAQALGKPILLKSVSDILSKWVGESEQNIRDAFDEAARTDSILLFDEVDSFFASRENAQYNWERTQVNEFLTQMEEFPGILICTTNLKQIMDPAMNRRFHIITEFKPLVEDGIRTLLDRYFSGMTFEDSQIRRLIAMNSVTPGDFGVLASRVRFMDSDERTPDYIISELCKIQDEKQNEGSGRQIGFGAA